MDIVEFAYKDNNIDSAYLTAWQSEDNDRGIINVVLLLNNNVDYYQYVGIIKGLEANAMNDTDIAICVDFDYFNRYFITALNPSDVHRIEALSESKVIFDKSWYITSVRNKMKKYGHLYQFHLTDYMPPLEDGISLQHKKKI